MHGTSDAMALPGSVRPFAAATSGDWAALQPWNAPLPFSSHRLGSRPADQEATGKGRTEDPRDGSPEADSTSDQVLDGVGVLGRNFIQLPESSEMRSRCSSSHTHTHTHEPRPVGYAWSGCRYGEETAAG